VVNEDDLKIWRDAGHVARRALESIKDEIQPGASWNNVIESAERYIHRHGGKAAFPVTIGVNDIAAHYTTDHGETNPPGWEEEMVFKKGDLVKLDIGVHVNGAIGDNALTLEVGNSNKHTDQIKASIEARDASIEKMHPGTPWHEVGAAAEQAQIDAGFAPISNLCGHQLETFNLHAGTSVPSFACGAENPSFKGEVQQGGIFAVEPFNTTGEQGLIENVAPRNSSNIWRITGDISVKKALAKNKLKPLGATMARYLEERYHQLPFAERWAFPLLQKPFPNDKDESLQNKWDALTKKLINIRFLETYHMLRCADGGLISQYEHTVWIAPGGAEILTVV